MSFQRTDEWLFCPACGSKGIEVDESRDDYYLGPIFRCAYGHGFYASPGDPTAIRYSGPPGPFDDLLLQMMRSEYAASYVLLKALTRPPSGKTIVIPIVVGPE